MGGWRWLERAGRTRCTPLFAHLNNCWRGRSRNSDVVSRSAQVAVAMRQRTLTASIRQHTNGLPPRRTEALLRAASKRAPLVSFTFASKSAADAVRGAAQDMAGGTGVGSIGSRWSVRPAHPVYAPGNQDTKAGWWLPGRRGLPRQRKRESGYCAAQFTLTAAWSRDAPSVAWGSMLQAVTVPIH